MLEHEQPDEEQCRRDREEQRQPIAHVEAPEHHEPEHG
jgi:hypothetical protein